MIQPTYMKQQHDGWLLHILHEHILCPDFHKAYTTCQEMILNFAARLETECEILNAFPRKYLHALLNNNSQRGFAGGVVTTPLSLTDKMLPVFRFGISSPSSCKS